MITSRQNQHIKLLEGLHKKKERDRLRLFLVEGKEELKRIPPNLIHEIYCRPGVTDNGIEIEETLFSTLVYRSTSDVLIVCKTFTIEPARLEKETFLVVVENVEKPGNLGALLRTCDAAGVGGVIATDQQTDLFNPNVVRAALGTLFTVPIVCMKTEEARRFIRDHRFSPIITSPSALRTHYEADYTGKIAVVVGGEHAGLSPPWMQNRDELVSIPMQGTVNSLNVSVSLGIILYEAFRKRHS